MKLKNILLSGLSLVLVAALAIGGTIAYLQDSDSDVNVMTLGNVEIEQIELQRKDGVDYKNGGEIASGDELEPFEQGQLLFPSTYTDLSDYSAKTPNAEQFWWGNYVTADVSGNGSSNGLWDDKLTGAMDKFVFVKNTGKSDCYYRTIIAFECPEGMEYSQSSDKEFMMNANLNNRFDLEKIGYTTIDGTRYSLYVFTYNKVLEPGTISRPSLLQVVMTHNATNEDMELLGDTYEILVVSQAVQTAGFADAKTALDTAFGEITTTNHPWAGEGNEPVIPTVVSDADGLVEALENNKDVVLTKSVKIDPAKMSNAYGKTGINVKNGQTIDGNGYTIDIKGAGGTWDSGINTTGGTIKNLTVTGSFRGIFINHNSTHSEPVILENVTIEGTTYTISCDQGMNQTLTATDSAFKGWTSFAATLGEATFIDCYFGEGNGYAYCRPYAPTTFVGCDFEAGYELDARAAVTFENCTIGGVALTADNLSTLVTSNIQNASVK